jgi:hypothetical protein
MKKSKKESNKLCIGELMHALTNQPPLSESADGRETGGGASMRTKATTQHHGTPPADAHLSSVRSFLFTMGHTLFHFPFCPHLQ